MESTQLRSLLLEELHHFSLMCAQFDTSEVLEDRRSFCQQENELLDVDLLPGERRCAIVPQKGSLNSVSNYTFQENEARSGKWTFSLALIYKIPYIVVCNSNIRSGINKVASDLCEHKLFGPVIFIMLDHEYKPTHMRVYTFKKKALRA
jgi:hypothetical protein